MIILHYFWACVLFLSAKNHGSVISLIKLIHLIILHLFNSMYYTIYIFYNTFENFTIIDMFQSNLCQFYVRLISFRILKTVSVYGGNYVIFNIYILQAFLIRLDFINQLNVFCFRIRNLPYTLMVWLQTFV